MIRVFILFMFVGCVGIEWCDLVDGLEVPEGVWYENGVVVFM